MPLFFGPASGNGSFDEFLVRYLQGQRAAQSRRTVDLTRLLSRRTHEVLAQAAASAAGLGHTEVDALHILRVMAEQEPAAGQIKLTGADPQDIVRAAEQSLPEKAEPSTRRRP